MEQIIVKKNNTEKDNSILKTILEGKWGEIKIVKDYVKYKTSPVYFKSKYQRIIKKTLIHK